MSNSLLVAKITGVHGVKGNLKLRSYLDNPEDIFLYNKDLFDKSGNNIRFSKVGRSSDQFIIQIDGILDRTKAESLINTGIYLARDLLPEIEGQIYQNDLIGFSVIYQEKILGEIVAFHNFGASDIIEYTIANSKKTEMIPYDDQYIIEINLEKRYIVTSYNIDLI